MKEEYRFPITFKDRWQKLKEWIEELYNESDFVSEDLFFIREKMQELDKEEVC